jgi:hypothetical protein
MCELSADDSGQGLVNTVMNSQVPGEGRKLSDHEIH